MAPEPAASTLHSLTAELPYLANLFMILQTPASRMASETLHLSVVDQRMVRVYTGALLIFPFDDGCQAETALDAIATGLRETLERFPFLAGTLHLSKTEADSGKLLLTYPTDVPGPTETGLFAKKNIPHSETFPYTYEQLRRDGMPPGVFTWERFRPDDLLNYAGVPVSGEGIVDFSKSNAPVMRVQATFIPGGLVLSTYIHHSVMDCSGIINFWTYFSKHVSIAGSKITNRPSKAPVLDVSPDQSLLRHKLDARAPVPIPGQRPVAESYTDGPHTYAKTLEDSSQCTLKYFVMPAQRIRAFRDRLKQYFPESSPPTICNVLAALAWTHVTRARVRRLGSCAKQHTRIGIATDLRKRMEPQLNQNYMGNLALLAQGMLDTTELTADERVTEQTVITAIGEIRRTITKVDNAWAQKHLAFFKSLTDIKDTECALDFRFGLDIYVTSWLNFGADLQWGIPGTDMHEEGLDGRPGYIRRTFAVADGGMMIMPRRRKLVNGEEAPYELMVRLAEVDMRALIEEEGGLSTWADRVIG